MSDFEKNASPIDAELTNESANPPAIAKQKGMQSQIPPVKNIRCIPGFIL